MVDLSNCQHSKCRKGDVGLTHCDDIASHRVAEGEIPSNSNKYIQESRNTYAGNDHSCSPKVRIIANLVQD